MACFNPFKRFLLVILIIIAGFYPTGKADAQTDKGKKALEPSASQVKEKVDSVLSSREVIRSIVAQDWEGVVNVLSRDSTYSVDARVWLLIGHAHLARNSNNVAYAVFSTILDSSSLDAWKTWTSDFVSSHPRSQVVHYLYGDALARNGDPDKAISEFTQALSIDSTFYLAANARGVAYAMKWLETEGKDDRYYDKARVDFHTATTLKPDWADAYANTGALMIQRGHAKRVNEAYAKAIETDSSFALAYNGRACALAKLDSIEYAKRCLVKADSLLPGIPFVALNAEAVAEPGDTLSDIGKIAATVPEGMSYDSLGRGFEFRIKPIDMNLRINLPVLDKLDFGRFKWGGAELLYQKNRGGVYFDGITVSETGKPQKVGTDFMLAYPHGEPSSVKETE